MEEWRINSRISQIGEGKIIVNKKEKAGRKKKQIN